MAASTVAWSADDANTVARSHLALPRDPRHGAAMSTDRAVAANDLLTLLPARVWHLTSNGGDLWCRRPYSFFFSSDRAATEFAAALGVGGELWPIGLDATAVVSSEFLTGLRSLDVTRIFLDPSIDPATGDVHGTILRLEALIN
jgi:hypothetical protein